jgi:uncharacterized radical SAM superfamily protein
MYPLRHTTFNGWEVRRRNFGNKIRFFAPSLKRYTTSEFNQSCSCYFKPVSVTGGRCALLCDHCRAGILSSMQAVLTPEDLVDFAGKLRAEGARGMLVSGGSDSRGVVPLIGFLDAIATIRETLDLKIIVHTAVTDENLARGLAAAGVDAALIDIIGADESIEEICHLRDVTVADYERSLANLAEAGVPVSPHVVIGLHRGEIRGEPAALEAISRYDIASLVLVGLTPRPGTPMAGIEPPSPLEMGELFLLARELLPRTSILLGCERPGGEHKQITDELALKAGLNGIAYPAEGIISLAEKLGLEPEMSEMCCALAFQKNLVDPDEIGGRSNERSGAERSGAEANHV